MTDAGPVDVLREPRDRHGRDVPFDVLRRRCEDQEIGGVVVHVAGLDDIIAARGGTGRDRTTKRFPELRELRDTS